MNRVTNSRTLKTCCELWHYLYYACSCFLLFYILWCKLMLLRLTQHQPFIQVAARVCEIIFTCSINQSVNEAHQSYSKNAFPCISSIQSTSKHSLFNFYQDNASTCYTSNHFLFHSNLYLYPIIQNTGNNTKLLLEYNMILISSSPNILRFWENWSLNMLSELLLTIILRELREMILNSCNMLAQL